MSSKLIDFVGSRDRPSGCEATLFGCRIGVGSTIDDRQLRVRQSRWFACRLHGRQIQGPLKSRVSDEAVDNVLFCLELELTLLESDDELLVQPVEETAQEKS